MEECCTDGRMFQYLYTNVKHVHVWNLKTKIFPLFLPIFRILYYEHILKWILIHLCDKIIQLEMHLCGTKIGEIFWKK